MISKVYILAPNCIIVKGYMRSTLLDLQKSKSLIISNSFSKLISKPLTINKIDSIGKEDLEMIQKLIGMDILILVPKSQVNLFPKLNTQYYNISEINNCIIELNTLTLSFANKIRDSLDNLNCKFVELRVSKEISFKKLLQFLIKFTTTSVESFNIYIEYVNEHFYTKLLTLKRSVPEVNLIYIFNMPNSFNVHRKNSSSEVVLLKNKSLDSKDCGNISPIYFSVNIATYTESINFNACLNCKLAIKGNGEVSQCPSIKKTYGNIKNSKLENVITKNGFNIYGSIKKDQIKVCKDCEFRYICTDCRAYLEDPDDTFSKPLKCGYDPYTGKWEEWSTLPVKQKAIKYYGMEHLIKN